MIIHYSKYHEASFGNFSNQVTGKINTQYSRINYYFHLKKTNDSLVKVNEELYNKLKKNYELPDTVTRTIVDSIRVDSVLEYRKYTYLAASVVSNSISTQNNYIVLSRGKANKLHAGMGIVDVKNAVVGIVTEATDDFSIVMSLLHKDSRVNGKLLRSGETGTVIWDGKLPNIITLTNIPKSAKIAKGDTIITSGYSTHFPKGLLIGTVMEIFAEKSTSNFLIKLKSSANFYDLQYVYAIDNAQQEPINKILDKIKQQR
ncbi:MAG: rod shape-determining protein MreC [Ferruginibacter sp.]